MSQMPDCRSVRWPRTKDAYETVRAFSQEREFPRLSRVETVRDHLISSGVVPAIMQTINAHKAPGGVSLYDTSGAFHAGVYHGNVLQASRTGQYNLRLNSWQSGGTLLDPIYWPLLKEEECYGRDLPSAMVMAADGVRTFGPQVQEHGRGFKVVGQPGEGDPAVIVDAMQALIRDTIAYIDSPHICMGI